MAYCIAQTLYKLIFGLDTRTGQFFSGISYLSIRTVDQFVCRQVWLHTNILPTKMVGSLIVVFVFLSASSFI
jgi:hypothetical protein